MNLPASVRRALPADAPDIAEVRVASWRATYRGLIPDAYLDAMKIAYSTALWQRAGLGRRLVAAVAEAQRAHGATGLLTWVIAGNRRARTFYERLGGEIVAEQPFQWDGMNLVEAGYGWHDLDALAAACDAAAI